MSPECLRTMRRILFRSSNLVQLAPDVVELIVHALKHRREVGVIEVAKELRNPFFNEPGNRLVDYRSPAPYG